jgi:hypothetical protein
MLIYLLIQIILCVVLTELLTELVIKSVIFQPVRNVFFRLGKWFTDLFKCGYCFSVWIAIGVVFLPHTPSPLTGNSWVDLGLMSLIVHRLSNYLHNFNDKFLDKYYSMRHINSEHKNG